MSKKEAKPQTAADKAAWSDITRKWGAAGGESLAALSASLKASSKADPMGLKPSAKG